MSATHPSGPSGTDKAPRILKTFSLHDKVCVITGAARGLGLVFAQAFVESGCGKVAILDKLADQASSAASDLIESAAREGYTIEAQSYALDVTKEEEVKAVIQNIVQKWGSIDCLVTAAGVVHNYPALEYPTSQFNALYDVNVHGSFFCAREVARHMKAGNVQGSIIFIASMSANIVNIPQPQFAYNASKAAVKHMAASLAVEWAPHGIRVNSLSPGYMNTPLLKAVKNATWEEIWINNTPLRRLGEPDDLKGAIVFLASDASTFVTGTDLRVDGGYTVV